MSFSKPKRNYMVTMTESTGHVVIPQRIRPETDVEELYIYVSEDEHGEPVLLFHTYDYSEVDRGVDEVEYTRKYDGTRTTIPSEVQIVYDEMDSWSEFVVEKFDNAHGTVFAFYPDSDSTHGE